MTKHELATALRLRQSKYINSHDAKAKFTRAQLDGIRARNKKANDLDMILSYITCPCCSESQVDIGTELDTVIDRASSVDHFFDLCNDAAARKQHADA